MFWLLDALDISDEQEKDLRLLACDYAEEVLHLFEDKYPDDKRPRLAIEAARKYANGEISKDELNKAAWAARNAAAADAWAARNAAAAYAADAARNAAAAAYDAAYAAADAAGRTARAAADAWAAGRNAARDTKKKQTQQLMQVLLKWEK